MSDNINILSGDSDRYITFGYSNNAFTSADAYSWRLGYIGSGENNSCASNSDLSTKSEIALCPPAPNSMWESVEPDFTNPAAVTFPLKLPKTEYIFDHL